MALLKDETLPQGITLAYHRIISFQVNLPEVRVQLAGYVSKDLRDQEKERETKQARLAELQIEIDEARAESGFDPEADNLELAAVGDEVNALTEELDVLGTERLYLKTVEYDVQIDGEATRDAIYEALKALPQFADAIDA